MWQAATHPAQPLPAPSHAAPPCRTNGASRHVAIKGVSGKGQVLSITLRRHGGTEGRHAAGRCWRRYPRWTTGRPLLPCTPTSAHPSPPQHTHPVPQPCTHTSSMVTPFRSAFCRALSSCCLQGRRQGGGWEEAGTSWGAPTGQRRVLHRGDTAAQVCCAACLHAAPDRTHPDRWLGTHGDWSMSVMLVVGMPALTTPCVQKPVPPPTSTTCSGGAWYGCGCAHAGSRLAQTRSRRNKPVALCTTEQAGRCLQGAAHLQVGAVQLRNGQRILAHVCGGGGEGGGRHDGSLASVVEQAGGQPCSARRRRKSSHNQSSAYANAPVVQWPGLTM